MIYPSRKYEPAIDGLRAVAVLAVLLCHADISGFQGGFIGVDIFFVISGYLITRNIASDLQENKFTFKQFYIRRARRIFPAMFFTMFLVFLFGIFIFSPVHLERLGGAILFSSLGFSNFFFWQEAGYWDTMKDFKPLLHYWSLAVEEQFYFIWPAFLCFLFYKFKFYKKTLFIIIALSAFSLFIAEAMVRIDASSAFYLMPFRIFEFGLGALLLWLRPLEKLSLKFSIMALSGFFIICFCIYTYSENSPFPGIWALLPCFAAATLIYTRDTRINRVLLTNVPMTYIGRISYSLYLIHWPILVFYNYVQLETVTSLEKINLMVISVAAAVLMYKYIEQPFRCNNKNQPYSKIFVTGIVCLLVTVTIPAVHAWKNDGWVWRPSDSEIKFTASDIEQMRLDNYEISRERKKTGFFERNPPKFIIIGDSYANDILNALEHNGIKNPVKRIPVRAGCLPLVGRPDLGKHPKILTNKDAKECQEKFQTILTSNELKEAHVIMIGAHWYQYGVKRLAPTVDAIRQKTQAPIIMFGHKMIYNGDVPTNINRYGKLDRLNEYINRGMLREESLKLDSDMKAAFKK